MAVGITMVMEWMGSVCGIALIVFFASLIGRLIFEYYKMKKGR